MILFLKNKAKLIKIYFYFAKSKAFNYQFLKLPISETFHK